MQDSTDVLVVGAGPVGLLMAAELRRHGVVCAVIDKLTEPAGWVKALGVSQRTLEVWDDLGVVTEALDAGLLLRRRHVFVNREQVLDADAACPDEAPYKYPLLLPQPETERILAAHLARLGGAVERGVELCSFVETGVGVEATLSSGGGRRTVCSRYLVGCDGAHSAVRHGLGLPFEGGQFPAAFLLADVAIGWQFSHAASCFFLEVRDGALEDLLVCIPYLDRSCPGRPRYRVSTVARPVSQTDWEGAPGAVPETAPLTLEQVQDLVGRFAPVAATVGDLRWSSVFRISHRIVPRYSVGRVFLAGDAAHIHPPTGGQGMNTGLQDAYNLAWKLALVVKGQAAPGLLDSYSAERQPVGQAVVSSTLQRSLSFADRSRDDLEAVRADAQLSVNYRGTAWVAEELSRPEALAAGPRPGDRAADVSGLRRDGLEFGLRLFDLLRGTHHTLLLYGAAAPGATVVAAGVEAWGRYGGAPLRVYRVVPPEAAGRGPDIYPTLVDAGRDFQRCYAAAAGAAYLVRPDGYVGFRTDASGPDSLGAYLGRVLRR
jgi:2-polyprenyl-6-methoxyphenol hydroxylase-like FAD-dependent oxidoreductase